MPKTLYHVWINDDNDTHIRNAEEYLQKRFPEALVTRKHTSYRDLDNTLMEGEYKEPSISPGQRRRHLKERERSPPPEILSPHLVIQDYVFALSHQAGVGYCKLSLEEITRYFPSAKVVISTTQENFQDAKAMLQENGWNFPVTDKISYRQGNPVIEQIIAYDLRELGYSTPEMYE